MISVSLLGALGRAQAQPKTDDPIKRALDLRRDGDDEGALVLLRQVYDQSHSPRSAAQVGLCEQALGRWPDAEAFLSEGLKSEDPWIRKNRSVLAQALGVIRSHIARVEVVGEPVAAEVLINGNVAGKLPLTSPIHVGAGEIQIEVRAPGYTRENKSLHIDPGQYQKMVFRLERPPASPPQASPPPSLVALPPAVSTTVPDAGDSGSAGVVASSPSIVQSVTVPAAENDTGSPSAWRGAAKWIAWGGAAAALGVGVYGTARNSTLVKDFDGGCGIDPASGFPRPAPGSTKTNAQCASLETSYQTASHVGIAGFVGSGVLGALGLVLWLTEPRRHESGAAVSHAHACAPLISPGLNAGLRCAWTF